MKLVTTKKIQSARPIKMYHFNTKIIHPKNKDIMLAYMLKNNHIVLGTSYLKH